MKGRNNPFLIALVMVKQGLSIAEGIVVAILVAVFGGWLIATPGRAGTLAGEKTNRVLSHVYSKVKEWDDI